MYRFATTMIALLAAVEWAGAQYPDTIRLPVTYYDFHSSASNPDFEPAQLSANYQGPIITLLAAATLDRNGKPKQGLVSFFSRNISYWFRSWSSYAKGDYTVPLYDADGAWLGDQISTSDTGYKNIVIQDSLAFVHGAGGSYQFRSDSFFPLDGRGYGSESKAHNYDFAMQLSTTALFKNGLVLTQGSTGDLWVYAKGQLAGDLGGIHSLDSTGITLNSVSGLVADSSYALDIFYTQRHSAASSLILTVNIPEPIPTIARDSKADWSLSKSVALCGVDGRVLAFALRTKELRSLTSLMIYDSRGVTVASAMRCNNYGIGHEWFVLNRSLHAGTYVANFAGSGIRFSILRN